MSETKFPTIAQWVRRMWQDSVVQECKVDPKLFVDFYAKYRTGKPDFTMGAKEPAEVPELENLDGLRDPSMRDRKANPK
jgi:hypothetical protein